MDPPDVGIIFLPYPYKSDASPTVGYANTDPWSYETQNLDTICQITYECSIFFTESNFASCNFIDGETVMSFDTSTGALLLETSDMATYASGATMFQIVGSVGNESGTYNIIISLIDPCDGTPLSFTTLPFDDFVYYIE